MEQKAQNQFCWEGNTKENFDEEYWRKGSQDLSGYCTDDIFFSLMAGGVPGILTFTHSFHPILTLAYQSSGKKQTLFPASLRAHSLLSTLGVSVNGLLLCVRV